MQKTDSWKDHTLSQACVAEYALKVPGNNRQCNKRTTQIELRYEQVSLCRPANVIPAPPHKKPDTFAVKNS